MRDVSGLVGVVVLAAGDRDPVPQFAKLDESEPNREENARPQQGNHLEGYGLAAKARTEAVDEALYGSDDLLECFHGCSEDVSEVREDGRSRALQQGRVYPGQLCYTHRPSGGHDVRIDI